MPPIDDPPVLMVFEGLLITHLNNAASKHQVGVVPAPEHQFSIMITEFHREITSEGPVDVPITTQEIRLSDFPPLRPLWTFEVLGGAATPASAFNSGTVPHRLGTLPLPPLSQDYRWPLQLHDTNDFPQHGGLTKERGVLNPIINFKNGLFYARATIRPDPMVFRKANREGRELLGIMSVQFAANIETIPIDSAMVLRNGDNEEVFRVIFRENRRFSILFRNTPPHLHPPTSGVASHFPLFYSAFRPATKRYDLVSVPSPFPGPSIPDVNPAGVFEGPAPFRCAPVGVNVPLED